MIPSDRLRAYATKVVEEHHLIAGTYCSHGVYPCSSIRLALMVLAALDRINEYQQWTGRTDPPEIAEDLAAMFKFLPEERGE